MQYLIANWKAQKSKEDVQKWIDTFTSLLDHHEEVAHALETKALCIIICPSFPFILPLKELTKNTSLHVGAQDVSAKDPGKYTGEVPALHLKGMIEYSIIGHSERRTHFNETDATVAEKVSQCKKNDIEPIVCVRGTEDMITPDAKIIAYEPVSAIGSGQNEEPARVIEMKKKLQITDQTRFIYGGSVAKENIKTYRDTREIDGYLVGTASLDAEHFFELAKQLI